MRTWWIVIWIIGGLETVSVPPGRIALQMMKERAIGPFWTYREAMEMMHRWN